VRLSILLTLLLAMTPVCVMADELSIEDDMGELPKAVSEAIYREEGKGLQVDEDDPAQGKCELMGKRVNLGGGKSAYFATTKEVCHWGANIGPMWLVLAEPRPAVVLGYSGVLLEQQKERHNGLPDFIAVAGTAGWSTRTWLRYDGKQYVGVKGETCTTQGEGTAKCTPMKMRKRGSAAEGGSR